MQVASILSDLTSLRVCDHSAALALVSVHKINTPSTGASSVNTAEQSNTHKDSDMQRVTDLMELHYGVKMSHVRGEDEGLNKARRDVDRVLQKLGESPSKKSSRKARG